MTDIDGPTCAICGEREAITRDHVPPVSIFVRPRPSNLITVPACWHCNSGASRDDEGFRNYLALHVASRSTSGKRLWEQSAVRGMCRNRRFLRDVIVPARPVYLASPGGIITGRGRAVPFDMPVIERVVRRSVRGLYFYHVGRYLPAAVPVTVKMLSGVSLETAEALRDWPGGSVGGRQFIYRFGYAEASPTMSVWLFCFHEALWLRAATDEEEMDRIETRSMDTVT